MPHYPNDPSDNEDFNEADIARIADLLGTVSSEDFERFEPPPSLWPAIAQRLEIDPFLDDPLPVGVIDLSEKSATVLDRGRTDAAQLPPEVTQGASGPAPIKAVRVKQIPLMLAAAAAAVVVLIGAAVLVQSRPEEELIASATLEQLEPLGSLSASATLVEDGDGQTRLVIEAVDMPEAPDGESYELWLIDEGVTDPRSLGEVTGSGEIVVPNTVDPSSHPIVDISLEPNDGDPAHSGHSLMRGTLA